MLAHLHHGDLSRSRPPAIDSEGATFLEQVYQHTQKTKEPSRRVIMKMIVGIKIKRFAKRLQKVRRVVSADNRFSSSGSSKMESSHQWLDAMRNMHEKRNPFFPPEWCCLGCENDVVMVYKTTFFLVKNADEKGPFECGGLITGGAKTVVENKKRHHGQHQRHHHQHQRHLHQHHHQCHNTRTQPPISTATFHDQNHHCHIHQEHYPTPPPSPPPQPISTSTPPRPPPLQRPPTLTSATVNATTTNANVNINTTTTTTTTASTNDTT
ncbi:unnamed protein product [Nesidiocoris tenuis]|uniref:Uncharacterized protein n=1 Tax=Nesidiocoris tenuis TaxID=355587 RepID=A0A6H5HGI9_9HEMI|nr:unnamed protein product [Nesidiocoris tenuis]